MNLIYAKNTSGNTVSAWGCPSFAPDNKGIDKSFRELIKAIIDAHKNAKATYPLEFFHLGCDEPAFYDFSFIGGIQPGEHGKNQPGSFYIPDTKREFSQLDRDWIISYLDPGTVYSDSTISLACQALMVRSLFEKINTITTLIPQAKILIYADPWDPSSTGGLLWFQSSFKKSNTADQYCFIQTVPDTSLGIIKLPGLSKEEKRLFKKHCILLPWNYSGRVKVQKKPKKYVDYNTLKTFTYFASNSFSFIYTFELLSINQTWPPDTRRVSQMNEFINTAELFKQNCYGYNAVHWGARWNMPKHRDCFRTIEELSKANR